MHRMMYTFLAVLFSTMNRSATLNFMHLGTNTQASGVTQGLIAAKYRLAKKSLMIPRLELMSGHMAVNLSTNVQAALEGFNMIEDKQCWVGQYQHLKTLLTWGA